MLNEDKSATKGQTLYDSTYAIYLDQKWIHKVEWWFPGTRGKERIGNSLMSTKFQFGKVRRFCW
jgi:hypothetical protein